MFSGPDADIQSLIGSFRPNQDEPSNKSNCFGFSTHQRLTENWIQGQIMFGLRVIDFTNRVNRHFPDLDIGALIEGFQPNQKELSYETTCYGIWTQPRSSSIWNQTNINYGLKVIQLLNRLILYLPYLEPSEFERLQTYLWRPGENIEHLEASKDVSSCTSIQRIRRILTHFNFLYLDSRAFNTFTLGAINHQRLFLLCFYVLGHFFDDQNVPEKLTYPLKPSRYKETSSTTSLTDLLIMVQRLVFYSML